MMVQSRFLNIVIVIPVVAIVLFPLYAVFFAYPSFEKLIAENTSRQAIPLAAILSSILIDEQVEAKKSHVDILGPVMNNAAKIQGMAKQNQILNGDDVYARIHPSIQSSFEKVVWKNNEWKYHRDDGQLYPVWVHTD